MRAGVCAQRVPVTRAQLEHGLPRLETLQHLAQRLRYRTARLGGGIGEDIDQFAVHQALFAAEDRGLEQQRRRADACAADADLQPLVVARRACVLERGLAHVQIPLQPLHGVVVRQRQRAPVAGHGGVEVHEVVAIEDDLLHVHLRPAHAQGVEEAKVAAMFHGCRVLSGALTGHADAPVARAYFRVRTPPDGTHSRQGTPWPASST